MFIYSKINAGYHAGNITYSWLYGYTYQIKLTTFTGIGGSLLIDPCQDTICFGDGTRAVILRSNGPIGGCAPGREGVPINPNIKLNEYVTTHTYPGPGNYTICFEAQNRNAGINNIPNSVNQLFSLESFLVIPAFGSGKNTSSVFGNLPLDYGCLANSCYNYNPAATDLDGDSLSYEVFACLNPGSLLPSVGAGGTFSINPITGTLTWCNPQYIGDYNTRIKITEWRKDDDGNPFIVGNVIRDTQFNMSNCTGINEEKGSENNITIFPNPANNFVSIQLSSKEKYSFQLYDMAGNLLSNQNCSHTTSYILNLENLAQGLYFLKITGNDNSTITKKIIKQ
jgi:hypothetical protein